MSAPPGRGRGEAPNITRLEEVNRPITAPGQVPILDIGTSSSSSSQTGSEDKLVMGRGGYNKQTELRTIPPGMTETCAQPQQGQQPIDIMTNFVRLTPMQERQVYQYRVDFEPNVESVKTRSKLFRDATKDLFRVRVVFDGGSDARCSQKTPTDQTNLTVQHPAEPDTTIKIAIKLVGTITWGSFEMMRLYNMQMKYFLKCLGFFAVGKTGTYVHPQLSTPVGESNMLVTIRGYKTAANVHEQDQILMNLESTHKLMQRKNVLQNLVDIRAQKPANLQEAARNQLIGKLVVTNYNKVVYKIEDINFGLNPSSTFRDERNNRDISYVEYYQTRHEQSIGDARQPLLLVTPNSMRAREGGDAGPQRDIYLVPELCNIAGLTDQQRNDNRIKTDLIRSSQVAPEERVKHLMVFLQKLHDNNDVKASLEQWGYTYDKDPIKIKGRVLPRESIGMGNMVQQPHDRWPKVDQSAGFDNILMKEKIAKPVKFKKLGIIIGRDSVRSEGQILGKLKQAFEAINCAPEEAPLIERLQSENSQAYVQALRQFPSDLTATVIILPNQNKEKYDSVKKLASLERGMITQVVTARLMTDDRKSRGAAIKIAVQVAAKIGGEPWYIVLPLAGAMICGYDTYHDSAQRGRSYGAFMASMNGKFSRWWSKVDSHDALDELSSNMAANLGLAMEKYKKNNGKYPDRVFLYRDGVGDGQLQHVFTIELERVRKLLKEVSSSTKFTFIVVNKRIGARFYMRQGNGFGNCPPGSIVDRVVTRKERYDFYLVSQSTRHGTVTPTYYNILADDSGLDPAKHQMMAYKMCFMYYNWTGTVRVPAPCQYAHKLALLCGEHLHGIPNAQLDDTLHFL